MVSDCLFPADCEVSGAAAANGNLCEAAEAAAEAAAPALSS